MYFPKSDGGQRNDCHIQRVEYGHVFEKVIAKGPSSNEQP
jgi:hypothetical protein